MTKAFEELCRIIFKRRKGYKYSLSLDGDIITIACFDDKGINQFAKSINMAKKNGARKLKEITEAIGALPEKYLKIGA